MQNAKFKMQTRPYTTKARAAQSRRSRRRFDLSRGYSERLEYGFESIAIERFDCHTLQLGVFAGNDRHISLGHPERLRDYLD